MDRKPDGHQAMFSRVAVWKAQPKDPNARRSAHLVVQAHLAVRHHLNWDAVLKFSGKRIGQADLNDALRLHDQTHQKGA